ncbi:ABC transporter permease [Solwaraspora sp. WMMD406]|uniref:ABC transporter permease n=1 Tax=Solwaraspora sp. WMMD406 TaxID=3016095 RepID=UPI0024178187|nr:ABC transporter permease [Solwaraspora sp. WMMD406]MDG4764451.1 ABC transporter permease [Solwaraspora sp. WMMD406]
MPSSDPTSASRLGGMIARAAAPVLGVAGLIAAWWAAVEATGIADYVVPAPPAVAAVIRDQPGYLLHHASVTLTTALTGYALATATAVTLGTVLAMSRPLARALTPTLLILSVLPKPALVPVLIIALGFGTGPKIVLVWLMCFLPIALATATGLTATPADLVELARSLTASRWQTFVKIRLPAALPYLFAGLRIALPLALIGAVVAELFGGLAGLGVVIQNAGTRADMAFAAITVLAAMSTTMYGLLTAACNAATPWTRHTTT